MATCPYCGTTLNPDSSTCPACGKTARPAAPGAGLPPPLPRAKPKSKTPWGVIIAVGCFGGLVFLGIIAALLVPNFLDALQKAKTKRTLADMRMLGTALESYKVDRESIPQVDSVAGLAEFLQPLYLQELPLTDGWQRELRYQCWSQSGDSGCDSYRLASAGRDGAFEQEDLRSYEPGEFAWGEYDRDLVYGDGGFLQIPGSTR